MTPSLQIFHITEQERSRRKAAIEYARGSVRYEGLALDERAEALFARYVSRELTRGALNQEVLALAEPSSKQNSPEAG